MKSTGTVGPHYLPFDPHFRPFTANYLTSSLRCAILSRVHRIPSLPSGPSPIWPSYPYLGRPPSTDHRRSRSVLERRAHLPRTCRGVEGSVVFVASLNTVHGTRPPSR